MKLISLSYLGYPKYKIDENGNIYRFIFNKTKYEINEFICNSVKEKYNVLTQKELSKEFKIPLSKIQKIVNLKEKDYWVLMKHTIDSNGYVSVRLYNQKGFKDFKLHQIICSIFYGPCPKNMECRHLDGNRNNYHPDNIIWSTLSENQQDRIKHGTSNRGEKCGRAKMNKKQILIIRYHQRYLSVSQLARIYKLANNTIYDIIKRNTWKDI